MPDLDALLQQKLDDLEAGQPLEEILASLPSEAADLKALILLASAVRATPHPEPGAENLAAQRGRIMAAAEVETRPLQRPDTLPTRPLPRQRPAWPWTGEKRSFLPRFDWRLAPAFSAALALLLCFGLAILAGALTGGRSTARLANVSGQVQVSGGAGDQEWMNVSTGQQLRSGQRLRTLGASGATLQFFEGSRTQIGPNSEVTLTRVDGSGRSLQVEMSQDGGSTSHEVIPLKGSGSFFLVHTPSGTATVHGTSFNVRVSQEGHTQVSVNRGEVRVENAATEVVVRAGQAIEAEPGLPPTDPAYQFTIQGSLIAMQPNAWIVSGIQFAVTGSTSVSGSPRLGDTIHVTGRVIENGWRVADLIEVAPNSNQSAYFTGLLESIEGDTWQVSGNDLQVTGATEIEEGLQVNEAVKVTFNILSDGQWLALKIESLEKSAVGPTPTPSASPVSGARPFLVFEPGEIEPARCSGNTYYLSGTLSNTAGGAGNFAANVQLGYMILTGGEYVQSVDISPSSWNRIEAGESVHYAVSIGMKNDFNGSAEDITLKIFVSQETNRPRQHTGSAVLTVSASCSSQESPGGLRPTPGSTATLTARPEPTTTGTARPSPTTTPDAILLVPAAPPTDDWQCTGSDPHPTGLTLAQRYNVPYEEIMHWFCQNYGFGEIDLAYNLSEASEWTVEEVFDMKKTGSGWGDVKKQVVPDEKLDQENNGQNKDKDKDRNKDKDKDKKDPKKKK